MNQILASKTLILFKEYLVELWIKFLLVNSKFRFQIISGNTDTETVVSHRLMPTVYGSKVRILPYSIHRRTVCLRVEVKGCPAEGQFRIFYIFFWIRQLFLTFEQEKKKRHGKVNGSHYSPKYCSLFGQGRVEREEKGEIFPINLVVPTTNNSKFA